MAAECGLEDLYRFDYARWSGCTHNMWHHIALFNLTECANPLHIGGHRVPHTSGLDPDVRLAIHAAQYLDDTFQVFDAFRGERPAVTSSLSTLLAALDREPSQAGGDASDTASSGD
jgi:hypothetical protein